MRVIWQPYSVGQTPLGVFHNVFTRCEPIKYVAVHVGRFRLTVLWGSE